jgi:NAD(P)-dependent dehydrogenase (short-subunit alcohol dehydrogenase family)
MFVYALARHLGGTGVTVNAAHPGIIAGTGLSREVPGLGELVRQAFRSGALPPPGPQPGGGARPYSLDPGSLPGPDVGADTPAWLATSPDIAGVTGRFFVDRTPVQTAPHSTDIDRCERLWNDSARLVGLPA